MRQHAGHHAIFHLFVTTYAVAVVAQLALSLPNGEKESAVCCTSIVRTSTTSSGRLRLRTVVLVPVSARERGARACSVDDWDVCWVSLLCWALEVDSVD